MKSMLFVLPGVPATLEDRKRLRPIGRNDDRYQQMLDELHKLAVFADEVGFDVFATTEHHFHSEGYEPRWRRSSSTLTSPPELSASSSRRSGW